MLRDAQQRVLKKKKPHIRGCFISGVQGHVGKLKGTPIRLNTAQETIQFFVRCFIFLDITFHVD
jgi:hypothetical protein